MARQTKLTEFYDEKLIKFGYINKYEGRVVRCHVCGEIVEAPLSPLPEVEIELWVFDMECPKCGKLTKAFWFSPNNIWILETLDFPSIRKVLFERFPSVLRRLGENVVFICRNCWSSIDQHKVFSAYSSILINKSKETRPFIGTRMYVEPPPEVEVVTLRVHLSKRERERISSGICYKKWCHHHITYEPEVVVPVCYSCHIKVHKNKDPKFVKQSKAKK